MFHHNNKREPKSDLETVKIKVRRQEKVTCYEAIVFLEKTKTKYKKQVLAHLGECSLLL